MSQPVEQSAANRATLERHSVALRRYFRRRLSDGTEVEDLVQETFARLLNRDPSAPIDNLTGYIFQIAGNLLRERGRQLHRRSAAIAPFLSNGLLENDEDLSAERIHAGRQAWALLEAALLELPVRVRNIFVLNRFEELSGADIARRLGVSLSTVEKDLARALLHLKERLQ